MKAAYFTKKDVWCCEQAGLQPVELGSGGEEEAALEAASGVESTNSEVSLSFLVTGNLGSEVAKCWIKHWACWACWPGTWKVRFETRWAGKRSRRERPGRLFGFPTTLLVRCLLLYKNWCNNTSQKTTFSPTYFEKVPSLHTLQHPQWLNNFEWNISSTTLHIWSFLSPQCMGCHTQFWFGRRKHHCRC